MTVLIVRSKVVYESDTGNADGGRSQSDERNNGGEPAVNDSIGDTNGENSVDNQPIDTPSADGDAEATFRPVDRWLVFVLRFSAFLCFAGWWWVHYYYEGPYGKLLWDERTYDLADRFGVSWDDFVGTGYNDGLIQKWLARLHWLFLACAAMTLTIRKRSKFQAAFLIVVGGGLLTVLSYAKYVGALRQLPMFVEHGGQILAPLLLVLALRFGPRHRVTLITAIVAFVATFAGHGSYALGLWPTPPTYTAMTIVILGVEYDTAITLLKTAGALDFVVCVGILVPLFRRSAAIYATIWGIVTAAARPVAGMSWGLNYWGADQYLHEVVIRAPHFLIPLYLFVLWSSKKNDARQLAAT